MLWPLIRRRRDNAVSRIACEMHEYSHFKRVCLLLHYPRRVGIGHSSSLVYQATPIFDNRRNHFYFYPRRSAAQLDYRTIGDVILLKEYESHSAVRRGGLVLVNLSRGRQPVAGERFHKNRTLASFYRSLDKLCLVQATNPSISASYLFEKQASKEIWSAWYPICSTSRRVWLINKRGNGSSCLSQLRKTFEGGSQGDIVPGQH